MQAMPDAVTTYAPRFFEVPESARYLHPVKVTAMINIWNGWVVHTPGFVGPQGRTVASNGDLAGCLVLTRKNVDSPQQTKAYVTDFHDPTSASLIYPRALGSNTNKAAGAAMATETSRFLHQSLGVAVPLSAEEHAALESERLDVHDFLKGSIDATAREAEGLVDAIANLEDSLGRHNPSAVRARLLKIERLLAQRQQAILGNFAGIHGRGQFVQAMLWRRQLEELALWQFFEGRDVLAGDDVGRFYELGLDTLNPVCQLVGYVCWELDRRDGRIEDPAVMETVRRALELHRYFGYLLEPIRALASLSKLKFGANLNRYQRDFHRELQYRDRFLHGFAIGQPYANFKRRLRTRLSRLDYALQQGDWYGVVAQAEAFRYTLVNRSWNANRAPEEWYGHYPLGSDVVSLGQKVTSQESRSLLSQAEIDDPFVGLSQ